MTSRHRDEERLVAERAIRQVRLLAVAVLLLLAAGHRPADGQWLGRGAAPSLALAAGALLAVLVAVGTPVLARRRPHHRTRLALAATGADVLVVLGVVGVAGLPPRSFAVVLLMLPLLEAALWSGLAGLGVAWLAATVALTGHTLAVGGPGLAAELTALLVTLPILLLATIPVAVLAEHLVAEVGRLQRARQVADERAALLGDLSSITAELFPLQLTAVAAALVTGAHRLGANAAEVRAVRGRIGGASPIASAGDPAALALLGDPRRGRGLQATPDHPAQAARTQVQEQAGRVLLTCPLPLGGDGDQFVFRAVLDGAAGDAARRVEALDLLLAQGQAALANAALVEQLGRLKQTYEELATRDQLTGLVNRRGLLAQAAAMPAGAGVLFCDLDGFKAVNDTFGHAAGDELLGQVARRLEAAVGAAGLVSRVGGDEFVVALPDADDADLAVLAGRIEDHVTAPYVLRAGPARIGVSIGTARSRRGRDGLDEVLDHADQVMYSVKRARHTTPRPTAPAAELESSR